MLRESQGFAQMTAALPAPRDKTHGTIIDRWIAQLFVAGTRVLTDANARWLGCEPEDRPRIYFANHTSHLDFLVLWSVLPLSIRRKTRAVAAEDYWMANAIRRHVSQRVFRCIFVDRQHGAGGHSVDPLLAALRRGESLALFPEGGRASCETVQPFRTGIFHIAQSLPHVELVPVWMDNNYRVLPKGSLLPLPLLCTATFGVPAHLEPGEDKYAFLNRLRHQLEQVRTI